MIGEAQSPQWIAWLTESRFLGNEIWRWAVLFGAILVSLVVGRIISFILDRHSRHISSRKGSSILAMVLRSMSGPIGLFMLGQGLYLAGLFSMRLLPDHLTFWINACKTISAISVGWFVYRLVDIMEFFLKRWTARTETMLDDQLVPLVRKTLRVFVVIVVVLFIAQSIYNMNIGAMMAGLGLGGLAFALAAKDTLSNFFGSVTIFADRPFQMGERVKIGNHEGTIEEVGFRSTRLRTLMGHLITIPNSVVANEPVENVGRRGYLKRVLNVTVTYDTPPDKLQRGVEIIREMLQQRSGSFSTETPPRVFFSDFNAESLNIVVYYWFTPPDWWEYLQFNHDFNMELLRRFNDEGIEFAFPTRTVYLKSDSPVEADARIPPGQDGE